MLEKYSIKHYIQERDIMLEKYSIKHYIQERVIILEKYSIKHYIQERDIFRKRFYSRRSRLPKRVMFQKKSHVMRHSKRYFRNHISERLIFQEMFQDESYIIKSYSTRRYSSRKYTGLFISPSGISELDCATTKTDMAERSVSIRRESLQGRPGP